MKLLLRPLRSLRGSEPIIDAIVSVIGSLIFCTACFAGAPDPGPPQPPSSTTPRPPADYFQMCQNAGVPIPPPLAGSPWVNQGTVSGLLPVGDPPSTTGTIYSWTSPNGGTCIALQRGNIVTGIICTNSSGSRSCFFNYNGPSGGVPIQNYDNPWTRPGMENCVTCHQGNSTYLYTEPVASILGGLNLPKPPSLYIPVGAPPSWENIGWSGTMCTGCHDMPRPNPRWCLTVGLPALTSGYMPPNPATSEDLADAMVAILTCCELLLQQGIRPPPICNGQPQLPVLTPTPVRTPVKDPHAE